MFGRTTGHGPPVFLSPLLCGDTLDTMLMDGSLRLVV